MTETARLARLAELEPDIRNANLHTERGTHLVSRSLEKLGAGRSILLDKHNRIIAGNLTTEQYAAMGGEEVQIIDSDGKTLIAVRRNDMDLDDPETGAREMAYADNRAAVVSIDFDAEQIAADVGAGIDVSDWWFEDELIDLGVLEPSENGHAQTQEQARQTLAERFVVPPFSVLDARQGYWQERKRAWLGLGLAGEVGREGTTIFSDSKTSVANVDYALSHYGKSLPPNISIFDPVLCEIAYRWFCPPGGLVVNPTAGESVYGIVAGYLGYRYKGVELRPEQVRSNEQQALDIGVDAEWTIGDGRHVYELVGEDADFIMCCPPYHDLEVYSDDPHDLSQLSDYDEFMEVYRVIVSESVRRLKENRFACFVVGDVRDKAGYYKNFVSDTVGAFIDAGCRLYNEAIFVTPAGSLPVRTSAQFPKGRKLGKTHQNVLVFVKGDWRKAVEACGPVEVSLPDGFGQNEN
jgi:hypothetical protein